MNDQTPISQADPQLAAPERGKGKATARRRLLTIFGLAIAAIALVWAVIHFFFAGSIEETDDAYVNGDIVSITARESGTVAAIHADNTEAVRAGQPLIELDPASADVSMEAAEAELARAVRSTRSSFSAVAEGDAEVVQAEAVLSQARNDYARRREAAVEGAVSGEELAHAQDAVKTARATLNATRSRLAQARTAVQGVPVARNPAVLAAVANLRRAAISQGHMRIIAPIDGVVAQRTVQLGQQVAAGTPLMAVVPLDTLWVDANFRETQLRHLRVGQPVMLKADVYGGDVVYHGRVLGLGAGSGNAFALLPPQNASGNWIKIVQRVPVRIGLQREELKQHPLRVGLSVTAEVDTADRSGSLVARPPGAARRGESIPAISPAAEARIREIIAQNSASGTR